MCYLNEDYILIHQTYRHYFVDFMKKKFIVDVVHDLRNSLPPDAGQGFLHVSNMFLFYIIWKCCITSP